LVSPSIPAATVQANLQFLASYTDIQMEPRNISFVEVDPSLIKSGDMFGIIRLDGLG
jgi:hypothetical protein